MNLQRQVPDPVAASVPRSPPGRCPRPGSPNREGKREQWAGPRARVGTFQISNLSKTGQVHLAAPIET